MNVGKRIQSLREQKDMTQKELADKIHINYSVMNRIESGERPVRDEEIRKIADVLDVSTDYLLGRTDIRNPYEPETIAAHHDGDEFTEEELQSIKEFKEFLRMKRKNKNNK
ncbi:helix-turn-helix domain-containing protein [Irregularibacter muris]|uniref:Helix-turn-helix domain-containing protein n=1 Tax=Irregularibacter muris TaxID=1796619 RepID=A0AAE3HCP6_9FIRM|nr:helix-turn-helix transcriptional regulator [Irregularibacter muris]MCR1897805.1 helix-turn-helix domain-containing protein [Irregularibacter muris]